MAKPKAGSLSGVKVGGKPTNPRSNKPKAPTDIRPLAAAASGLENINPAAAQRLREELRKRMAPGYKAAEGGTVRKKKLDYSKKGTTFDPPPRPMARGGTVKKAKTATSPAGTRTAAKGATVKRAAPKSAAKMPMKMPGGHMMKGKMPMSRGGTARRK